jgi:5-methyltetrahydropteroyltriglutamate--homocysteine methyltransferase
MAALPRTKPPFRADHVGSLLRPKKLFEARAAWHAGSLSAAELRRIEDDCVRHAVALQEGAGLKSVTDGDFRRDDWFLDFMFGFEGMDRGTDTVRVPFSDGVDFDAPLAKVVRKFRCPPGGIAVEAFRFLKAATRQTPKLCIPAPAMFYTIIDRARVDQSAYPDLDAFWSDLGQAYHDAVQAYGAAGCTWLQIDDVNSANLADPNWQAHWRSRGYDSERMVDNFIAVNNAAIGKRPAGMTAAIHMCKGNYQSQFAARGGYDRVAERYFTQSQVDAFFLEYDDERSGDFAPLRFMPKDKIVVLGLMTSKRPALEGADALKRRIEAATKYVPLERLCISPQCGFASTQEGNKLTEDEQRRKIEHLVRIAGDVWGSA